MIRETSTGVEIAVRVVPRAKKTELGGARGDALLVRLAAPPVDGAANDALVAFLAAVLEIPRRAVRLVTGEHARDRRIAIDAVTADTVRRCLRIS